MNTPSAPGPNGEQFVAVNNSTLLTVYIHAPRWYDAREAAVAWFGCERHDVSVTPCKPLHKGRRSVFAPARLRVTYQGNNNQLARKVELV